MHNGISRYAPVKTLEVFPWGGHGGEVDRVMGLHDRTTEGLGTQSGSSWVCQWGERNEVHLSPSRRISGAITASNHRNHCTKSPSSREKTSETWKTTDAPQIENSLITKAIKTLTLDRIRPDSHQKFSALKQNLNGWCQDDDEEEEEVRARKQRTTKDVHS